MNKVKKTVDKDFTETSKGKAIKKNKKWTLLLVGDHGEIRYIRNFIGVMKTLLIALFIAISVAVFYIVIYKNAKNRNEELMSALNTARDQALSLKEEKALLLVRLVVTEEKNKAWTTEIKTGRKSEQVKSKKSKKEKSGKRKISAKQNKIFGSAKTASKKAKKKQTPAVVPEMILKIAVDNFSYSISTNNSIIKTKFKLTNKSLNLRSVAGHAFVMLKSNAMDKNKWFIFPQVAIINGKPAIVKKGRFFSISNYNIIKFSRKTPIENIESFNEAKVFVYGSNGTLLMEKIFPFSAKLNQTAVSPNTEPTPSIESVVKKDKDLPVQAEEEQKIIHAVENVAPQIVGKNKAEEVIQLVKPNIEK